MNVSNLVDMYDHYECLVHLSCVVQHIWVEVANGKLLTHTDRILRIYFCQRLVATFVTHHHLFSYMKSIQNIHNILTVKKKILINAKLFYWPVNSSSIYCPLSNCWRTMFNKSRDIDVTMSRGVVQILGLDGWGYWKHLMDKWIKKLKKN